MNHFAPCSCTKVSSCSVFAHLPCNCCVPTEKCKGAISVVYCVWWRFVSWSDLWLLPHITVTWLSFFCRLFLFIFVIAYLYVCDCICVLSSTLNRKPSQNCCTFTVFCRFNGHVCCCSLSFFLRITVLMFTNTVCEIVLSQLAYHLSVIYK